MRNIHALIFLFAAVLVVLLGAAITFPHIYFWILFLVIGSAIAVLVVMSVLLIRKKAYRNGKIYAGLFAVIIVTGIGIILSPENVLKLNFHLHKDALTQEVQNTMATINEQTPEGWGHSQSIPTIWKSENKEGISYKKEGSVVMIWINGMTGIGKAHCITYLSDPQAEQLLRKECIDFHWIEEGQWAYTTIS